MEARLEAVKRGTFGKNEARRLRAKGNIPAVLYGGASADGTPQATPIAVDPKALMNILRGESGVNTLIGLKVGSEEVKVLMREYQVDPLTRRLLHVDFYRIAMDRMLTVTVPVTVKGEPKGVKQQGGIVDFVNRELEVECLPGDIPEHIDIDISELMLHQGVRVRDVAQDAKWKAVSEPDMMIVHVVTVKVEEVAAPAEGAVAAAAPAAPAEPEVIKKGKKEEEEK